MADATPPTPPKPKAAGKSLAGVFKGKPAWVWIAGITILIGVAYLARRRSQAQLSDEGELPTVVDNTTGSVGDSSLYPSASQGAYGGYSDPAYVPTTDNVNDNAGAPESHPIIINIPGPQDLSQVGSGTGTADPAPSSAIASGGKTASAGAAVHAPVQATPVQKALAIIQSIQANDPAHSATAAQQAAQAKAAAVPTVNTQDAGSRGGLNYKVVVKDKKVYYFYESRPGKGDWGEGGKVYKRPAS